MIGVLAHGLIQRATLPIPEELFAAAAALVLVVSFVALAVLWPRPRLARDDWRPLPGGRALGSPVFEWVCRGVGVVLLVAVIASGLGGTENPLNNFATTFVFIIFWVGLAFASVVLGNVFGYLSPWRAVRLRGAAPTPSGSAAGQRR